MSTPKTRHYPCCFTLESNPGLLAGIFCISGISLFLFYGIKMEHFNKGAGCQWVRYDRMPVKDQNQGKFCSQSWNMGTK